jgi:cysteine desulfurase
VLASRNAIVAYIDCNATTQVDQRCIQKMLTTLSERWGNPSSCDHTFGWDAADAVTEARIHVARLVNANPTEIIFTSGATESVNWVFGKCAETAGVNGIVTVCTEHESVLHACREMTKSVSRHVELLRVDTTGQIEADTFATACVLRQPSLVSVMLANNEIGTIHAVQNLSKVARATGALFFSDVTQAIGKMAIDVRELGIDLAAFSAHKLYGPKGVGALFIRSGAPEIQLEPLFFGSGQERALRAGTLNVPGIVGFGEACRIAKLEMAEDNARIRALRDKLESSLLAVLPDIWINGDLENRLTNTSNIGFRGVDARTLIRDMHDIAVSTKSACSSGDPSPSHVLKAIGLTDDEAYSCIRFSLGRFTTEQEIDYAISKVIASVRKLRNNLRARVI